MRQINPDVCAAYPITPSTQIMEEFSQFVADGRVATNLVAVESEHSAMSACIGAAAAGGRVITATSANGLALMWEMLYIASGTRLPIVMAVVNRALSGPINIHGDHSDTMGARDSGWIQLYSENAQEAYDNMIQAVRISEHPDVRLPVLVGQDGFIISHSIEPVNYLEDDEVKKFIGDYLPHYPMLDVDHPVTYGPADLPNYYTEHKRQQVEAMKHARQVILDVGAEYEKLRGKPFTYFETYRMEDAEIAILTLSSSAGTTREVVDEFRSRGVKVGVVKLRVFRPFPAAELVELLKGLKALAVFDRSDSFGAFGGPVYMEVRSALYDADDTPPVINYIYGLGGRDLTMNDIARAYRNLEDIAEQGRVPREYEYLHVRE
jgi:pyruvate ferredoxin oxidoreductase alpha subunit